MSKRKLYLANMTCNSYTPMTDRTNKHGIMPVNSKKLPPPSLPFFSIPTIRPSPSGSQTPIRGLPLHACLCQRTASLAGTEVSRPSLPGLGTNRNGRGWFAEPRVRTERAVVMGQCRCPPREAWSLPLHEPHSARSASLPREPVQRRRKSVRPARARRWKHVAYRKLLVQSTL